VGKGFATPALRAPCSAPFSVSNELSANPLREGLSNRPMPQPCNVVIFGASGDLTFRKLIPALYNLAADGDLPSAANIIGFARREKSDESWRTELKETTAKCSRSGLNEEVWANFSQHIYYHRGEFQDSKCYETLKAKLDALDAKSGTRGNRLFYLSVSPAEYAGILEQLAAAGLTHAKAGAWARVIVEKPFGTDLKTARELNEGIGRAFPERDTFRIDHYLGKETAQNIMVLRFANSILEPLWNHRYPHRPLSRQRNRAEHHGAAVRELDLRAAVESPVHRSRPNHERRDARRRSPRALLR
jgi:glucose-6-phosphate 1-dehydrogenase